MPDSGRPAPDPNDPYGLNIHITPPPSGSSGGGVTQGNVKETPASKINPAAFIGVPEGHIPMDAQGHIIQQTQMQPGMPGAPWLLSGGGGNQAGSPPTMVSGIGTPYNNNPYTEGMAWGPLKQPKSEIIQIQDAMVNAGLLDKAKETPGAWGYAEAQAYQIVLMEANAAGANAKDMLNRMAANPAAGKGSTYRPPFPVTNPADYADAGVRQATQLMGGGLSTAEQMQIGQYGVQAEAQALNRYNQVDTSSTRADRLAYMNAPNPDAAARQYLVAHNQDQIRAYDTALRTVQFHDMLQSL